MNDRKLLERIVWAFDRSNLAGDREWQLKLAIEELRARLAQPEQEPVAWLYEGDDVYGRDVCLNEDIFEEQKPNCIPLYTAPPQREWQGLTDEEIRDAWFTGEPYDKCVRILEAKLKEKNA